MNNILSIAVIQGSVRKGRKSIYISKFINEIIKKEGYNNILLDPKKLINNKSNKYENSIKKADGFIIVVSEYNHSFPGSLKILLDKQFKNYKHKPAMLVGVSSGSFGGVRAIQSLLPVVRELGLIITNNDVYFSNIKNQIDISGNLNQEYKNMYEKRFKKSLKELIWLIQTLKYGRENL